MEQRRDLKFGRAIRKAYAGADARTHPIHSSGHARSASAEDRRWQRTPSAEDRLGRDLLWHRSAVAEDCFGRASLHLSDASAEDRCGRGLLVIEDRFEGVPLCCQDPEECGTTSHHRRWLSVTAVSPYACSWCGACLACQTYKIFACLTYLTLSYMSDVQKLQMSDISYISLFKHQRKPKPFILFQN